MGKAFRRYRCGYSDARSPSAPRSHLKVWATKLANPNTAAAAGGEGVKNRPCWESTTPAIVVYKRSWRRFFGPCQQNLKNAPPNTEACGKCRSRGNRIRWPSATSTYRFPQPLGKHKTLSTLSTRPDDSTQTWKPEDQNILAGTDSEGVENSCPEHLYYGRF